MQGMREMWDLWGTHRRGKGNGKGLELVYRLDLVGWMDGLESRMVQGSSLDLVRNDRKVSMGMQGKEL